MGLFDFFKDKAKRDEQLDSITNLTLDAMRPGFLVDYDLKTWEVKAANKYIWGEALSLEWQLVSASDTLYLECATDDETEWCISRPISFRSLGDAVRKTILETSDAPEEITWQGKTYYLEETAGGHYFANGQVAMKDEGDPLLLWDYETEDGEEYLTIEQWGENDFEAYAGGPAHEYQFSNILPPAR